VHCESRSVGGNALPTAVRISSPIDPVSKEPWREHPSPRTQALRFECVIKLRAAGRLALTIPPALLARADEAIE
jgi:hypothetical protein